MLRRTGQQDVSYLCSKSNLRIQWDILYLMSVSKAEMRGNVPEAAGTCITLVPISAVSAHIANEGLGVHNEPP